MKDSLPRSPFSTALSGPASETELRIRNILSGPKKHPPLLLVASMCAMALLCGNLVSCQNSEAVELKDNRNASITVPAEGVQSKPETVNSTLTAELELSITPESRLENPLACLTEEQTELLQNLPAAELPRQSVIPGYATRQDYWRDMLLPVAYDSANDVSVYFIVSPDSMPNVGPKVSPDLFALDRDGIVLRHGNQTAYFPLCWDINAKFGAPPLLLTDDLNHDGQLEAALALTWAEGTGCYCQCLYIFDLDSMTYTVPDYSSIPLNFTYDPDGTRGTLSSGEDKFLPVDLKRLGVPFQGSAEVGNQVTFTNSDGQITCRLMVDFSCNTLGYLSSAELPLVYENGSYRFGPAAALRDML